MSGGAVAVTRSLSIALALLLAAAPAVAQRPGALAGVVYDSLIGAPLAGAQVWIRGTTRGAVTDGAGRFHIDSVPAGTYVVSFEHPELDSIGLSANAARVPVLEGRTFEVALATRSAATLRSAACGDRGIGPDGDSGIVFGSVADAETGVRLAGAATAATWEVARRTAEGGVSSAPQRIMARTDSTGTYYLCGVPVGAVLALQAFADSFASGAIDARVSPRRLLRRDMTVSREPLRAAATGPRRPGLADSTAPLRGSAVLAGTVTEERGLPRVGATIMVEGAAASTTTDERGRFVLTGLPSGSRMVMARLVGYAPARQAVDLRNRDTARVALRLSAITIMDTIRVVAEGRLGQLRSEIARRRNVYSGSVLLEDDIRGRGNTRSLFFGMPNVITTGTHYSRYRLLIQRGSQRWCEPTIYIDGIRATQEELVAYQAAHLVAVEVYPRPIGGDVDRYTSPDGCGIVLVWTKLLR